MPIQNRKGLIYRAFCTVTRKSYIGLTQTTLETRRKGHINNALVKKLNSHFYRAIRKYGTSAFKWSILEEDIETLEELKQKEIYWIAKYDSYKNGYNQTLGGDLFPEERIIARNKVIQSSEVRAKISEKVKKSYQEHPKKLEALRTRNRIYANSSEHKLRSSERAKKRIEENPNLMKELSDLANMPEAKEKRKESMKKHYENHESTFYKTLQENGRKTMADPEHCKKMWANAHTPEAIKKMRKSLIEYNKTPEAKEWKSKCGKEQMTEERKESLRIARQNTIIKKMNMILSRIEGEVTEENYNRIRAELSLKDPSYKWYVKHINSQV